MGILYGKYYAFLYKFYHLIRIFKHLSMRIRKVLLYVTNQSGNISRGETVPLRFNLKGTSERERSFLYCNCSLQYGHIRMFFTVPLSGCIFVDLVSESLFRNLFSAAVQASKKKR